MALSLLPHSATKTVYFVRHGEVRCAKAQKPVLSASDLTTGHAQRRGRH